MAPSELPDDVLSACAAGELSPTEAEAVRARAASDPALSARLAAAERVERALRADDLLPVPLALLATILERVHAEPTLGTGSTEPVAPGVAASLAAPAPPASPSQRTPVAVRRWGAIAAAILVSLGLFAATSGFEPTTALGLPDAGAGAGLSASLGGGLPSPIARTYDVGDAWARLAPAPASTPMPSVLWITGGLGLLAAAGVLARRFRPLFEAATASHATASPRTA